MKGIILRKTLETAYVQLTVGHTMTGKVFTKAVRGHMMSACAVLSLLLLLEKFWDSLTTGEQAQLVKIYDSPNPKEYKNDPIAVHFMQWFLPKRRTLFKIKNSCSLA